MNEKIVSEYNWYMSVDVYDIDDIVNRIAFINSVVVTDSPVIDSENFEEVFYEQVKKPFIENLPPTQFGVEKGYVFDARSITYLGENVYEYEEE